MMKKLVLTALAGSMVAASSLMAGEAFVGVDVGGATSGATSNVSGTVGAVSINRSDSGDGTGGAQALKVGYYFNDNNRAYISLHRFNTESNLKISLYKASYDYLIGSEALKPFVGASLGSYSYKVSGFGSYLTQDSLEAKGIAYGAQVGLLYKISKNIDAQFSYSYLKTTGSDSSTYKSAPAVTAKLENDKLTSWQFGLNYRF
jgi:Outer membrane protein beta-barrel domain